MKREEKRRVFIAEVADLRRKLPSAVAYKIKTPVLMTCTALLPYGKLFLGLPLHAPALEVQRLFPFSIIELPYLFHKLNYFIFL